MFGAEVLYQLLRLVSVVDVYYVLDALGQTDVDLEQRKAWPGRVLGRLLVLRLLHASVEVL